MRTSILVLVAALTSACGSASLPQSQPHAFLDKEPPAMEQMGLDGAMIAFPQKGSVTVVDFWATSCKPCVKMMPSIEALYNSHKDAGVKVIGVAVDDNPGLVEKRLKELGVTYPNVLDDSASTLRGTYQVDELPQTFIFDKQGRLRVATKGGEETDVSIIQDAVDALAAESP